MTESDTKVGGHPLIVGSIWLQHVGIRLQPQPLHRVRATLADSGRPFSINALLPTSFGCLIVNLEVGHTFLPSSHGQDIGASQRALPSSEQELTTYGLFQLWSRDRRL